jgi:hypothetical protein
MRCARRTWPRALRSSRLLATKTVHVTRDANASPMMTAFTTMSAFRNMPHGDRSCGKRALPIDGSLVGGCAGDAAGVFGVVALGGATGVTGAVAALAAGDCSAGAVELCAIAGGTSADIVSSAAINAAIVARRPHFILFLIITDISTFLYPRPVGRCAVFLWIVAIAAMPNSALFAPPDGQIFFDTPMK